MCLLGISVRSETNDALSTYLQEGRDGYDTVEAIAVLDWCNGSVALAGNSWLAAAQWFVLSYPVSAHSHSLCSARTFECNITD